MFEILDRPDGRCRNADAPLRVRSGYDEAPFVLRMRENRSHLSQHARETFTVLIGLFMAAAIVPALQGRILVPLFAIGTMGALVLALEWHKAKPPPEEWLEIGDGQWRYRDEAGRSVNLPAYWLRFELERRSAADCRLVFHHRTQRFEVGQCLNLDERREIAPILARALAASNKR
ncbi:hypothetical protein ASE06_06375 [Sphingopyxis sp. Root214]|uniref:DUF2244 domain-containing protein n=2 Tax=unclassified Sphingopyxis TaxID=2614943 RepID=UPI0006F614D4|nr:DUF2244 domain-containing protein [Sphingopyxis sp. Root214]KQZ76630.1 hypothetical protein ASD73_01620 [Sphingopyxis sp. Root154]KRC09483.1 hypothetical protein ASE06_06375 [Sphingopyxis sp. Root214]